MSSRKIIDLHMLFQPMVRSLLEQGQKTTTWKLFITDGYRSFDEQNSLYAQGRTKSGKIVTNARAGQSAHNFGLAVDLAFQKNGVLSYDPNLYTPVYKIARSLGFELGADWVSFSDKPHFNYPQWEKISKGEQPMTDPLKECLAQHRELVDENISMKDQIERLKMYKESLEERVRELEFAIVEDSKEIPETLIVGGKTLIIDGATADNQGFVEANYKVQT